MRNTTKTFVASVGMGICAISYAIGANSAAGTTFSLGALNTTSGSSNPTVGVDTGASSSNSSSAQPSSSGSATSKSTSSQSAKPSTSSTAKPSSSSTASAASKKKKTTKKTTSTGSSSAPTPKPTHTSSSAPTPKPSTSTPPPSSTTVTKTGAVFNDNDRWGDYAQVSVTKTNGKVTAVNVVSSYATSQWQSAYPYLAQLAVASNGAPVAALSGATYASAAFNGALASAMSKF